eukprot:s1123_g1.t1
MATAEPQLEGEGTLAAAGDLVLRGSYGAEFIGTFILVLAFGCVAASSSLTLSWKPTAVACTVTVMIYSTAIVSGGFLNPALSLSLSFVGVIPTSRWLGLCLVQCSAGLCAAATLRALVGVSGNGGGAFAQLAAPLHLDVPPKALYPNTLAAWPLVGPWLVLVVHSHPLFRGLLLPGLEAQQQQAGEEPIGGGPGDWLPGSTHNHHSRIHRFRPGATWCMMSFEVTSSQQSRPSPVPANSFVAPNQAAFNRRWAAGMLLLGVTCGFFSLLLATAAGAFNSMSGFEAKNACFLHQEARRFTGQPEDTEGSSVNGREFSDIQVTKVKAHRDLSQITDLTEKWKAVMNDKADKLAKACLKRTWHDCYAEVSSSIDARKHDIAMLHTFHSMWREMNEEALRLCKKDSDTPEPGMPSFHVQLNPDNLVAIPCVVEPKDIDQCPYTSVFAQRVVQYFHNLQWDPEAPSISCLELYVDFCLWTGTVAPCLLHVGARNSRGPVRSYVLPDMSPAADAVQATLREQHPSIRTSVHPSFASARALRFATLSNVPKTRLVDDHREVSEMVSKSNYPAAKLFFSFTLVGSLSLLLSKYPWELSNVYLGGTPKLRLLTAARAVAPPIGMLIVCTIPVVPRVNRISVATRLACNVHNMGACLYVGGYNLVEFITLKVLWPKLDINERILRGICVVGGLVCTVGFLGIGALYTQADYLDICCTDKYNRTEDAFRRVYHLDNSTQTGYIQQLLALESFGPFVLVDSASGAALALKKLEFWLEEFAGVFDTSGFWAERIALTGKNGGHALRLEAGAPAMNPAIALSVASMSPGGMQYGTGWIIAEMLGALLGTYLFTWLRAGAEDSCEEFLDLMAPRRPARLLAELQLGKTSGGHFNPAVTLAVVLSGRSVCPVADGLLYALVQIVAGLSAGLLVAVYHMNGPFAFLSLTPTDYGVVTVGIAEGVFTFVLAYATLACSTAGAVPTASGRRQNYFFGLAEGFCVMTGGCAVGSITGGMMNPAVAAGVWLLNLEELGSIKEAGISLGTCLKFSTWQCTGGLIAAVVFRITHPSEYCKAPLLAETESALHFAANCRKVFTHPMKNEEPKNETAFALRRELDQLARELANSENTEVRRELSERLTTAQLLSEQHGSWEELLARSKELETERHHVLSCLGLLGPGGLSRAASARSVTAKSTARGTQTSRKLSSGGLRDDEEPCLVNICDDPLLSGCLRYSLPANRLVHIGSSTSCQVHVDGLGIKPEMCSVMWRPGYDVEVQVESSDPWPSQRSMGALYKIGPPKVLINGRQVVDHASLRTGDVLQVGHGHMFQLLSQPSRQGAISGRVRPREGQTVDPGLVEELEAEFGLDSASAVVAVLQDLQPLLDEASDLTQELRGRPIVFQAEVLHQHLGPRAADRRNMRPRPVEPEIVVALRAEGCNDRLEGYKGTLALGSPLLTVWSIDKFKERLEVHPPNATRRPSSPMAQQLRALSGGRTNVVNATARASYDPWLEIWGQMDAFEEKWEKKLLSGDDHYWLTRPAHGAHGAHGGDGRLRQERRDFSATTLETFHEGWEGYPWGKPRDRLFDRVNVLEAQQPRVEKRLAELDGKVKGLSDELQGQIRQVHLLDDRRWEWKQKIEEEPPGHRPSGEVPSLTATDAGAGGFESQPFTGGAELAHLEDSRQQRTWHSALEEGLSAAARERNAMQQEVHEGFVNVCERLAALEMKQLEDLPVATDTLALKGVANDDFATEVLSKRLEEQL